MQPFTTSAILTVPAPFTASVACALPGPPALQAAVPHQPHAHSREVMRHPTSPFPGCQHMGCTSPNTELIKAVFLNLCLPPCSRQQIVPSIFMTPVFPQTPELREQHKSISSVAHDYTKGASHRPKVDLRHKHPKQRCISTTVFTSGRDVKEKGINHDKREKCRICSEVPAAG